MKKLLLTLMLFALVTMGFAQVATDGDYRSVASGNWSNPATWQVRAGGTWAAASVIPAATNNVYIQDLNFIDVDIATVNCKDLDINTSGGVNIGLNTLNVSGKIRAYTGTAAILTTDGGYTGTSSIVLTTPMITNTSPGVLRFIGGTRNITESAEWKATQTSNDIEIALDANAIATAISDFKFKNVTITSGTLKSSQRLAVAETFTIKNGGSFLTDKSSSSFVAASSTETSGTFTIEEGGVLELQGGTPIINVTNFINNGTIIYSKAGGQVLLANTSPNPAITEYSTLIFSASGSRTTINAITVSKLLDLGGTIQFKAEGANTCTMANNSTINRTSTASTVINSSTVLVLGTAPTDLVNLTIGADVAYSGEFPSTQAPGKIGTLTVNSGSTYTLTGGRNITNLVTNGITKLLPSATLTLYINGNISGTGTITGHSGGSIEINGNDGDAGTINLTPGSQTLNNLIINRTGTNPSVTLGSDVSIMGNLSLTSGVIKIAPSKKLTLSATTSINGSPFTGSSYIETQNTGADVGVLNVLGLTSATTFPLGNNSNYLPVTLTPVSLSDFAINVFQGATVDATPNGTPISADQKKIAVDALWNINRTSGSGDCEVSLGWTAGLEGSEFANLSDFNIGLAKNDGGTYTNYTAATADNSANTITQTISSFSTFIIGKLGLSPLPVKLISFAAKASNQTTVLNWKATSEKDLSHYLVQRSTNGQTFATLGTVKANNTDGTFNYDFTDDAPAFGANYYQLVSVDTDGKTSTTAIQVVNFGTGANLSIYPNPTQGNINVAGLAKGDVVIITDLIGRTLSSATYAGEGSLSLSLSDSNVGVYLLTVSNNGKITSTHRIVKN